MTPCDCSHGTTPAVVPPVQAVTDGSMPLEERMRVLQVRFVEVLQDQLKQDKQVTDLQVQLEASHKETEAGGSMTDVAVDDLCTALHGSSSTDRHAHHLCMCLITAT